MSQQKTFLLMEQLKLSHLHGLESWWKQAKTLVIRFTGRMELSIIQNIQKTNFAVKGSNTSSVLKSQVAIQVQIASQHLTWNFGLLVRSFHTLILLHKE